MKQKRIFKQLVTLVLVFVLTVAGIGVTPQVDAATKIKINKTSASLYVGSSTTLKISGSSKKVTWSSNKTSVATVSSKGKVTAKKAGTAVVTAKVSGKKYTCTVKVKNPYLNAKTKTLTAGKTYTLKITGTKAKTWTSNKTSVATVSKAGKVTARKAGTAIITCKGSNGKSYKATITVKAATAISKTNTSTNNASSTNTSTNKSSTNKSNTNSSNTSTSANTSTSSTALTASKVYTDMIAMKSKYPEGMTWTNANYYAWHGGIYTGGYGCVGFAFILSDAAFGNLKARKHTDISNIKVGDILRINNDSHSVIVLEVKSNSYIVAEGNYNSKIHWGREITKSNLQANFNYVMTRYPQ